MDSLVLQKLQRDLRTLIQKYILQLPPDDPEGVALSFLAPDKEFVAALGSVPTINCYLIGINEDKKRRQSEPLRSRLNENKTERTGTYEPRFVDVSYMLTVWCRDKKNSAEIEHLILGYLIAGLGASDFFPGVELENSQLEQTLYGIRMTLFGSDYADKISGQVWQAMGATPKPCLMLSLSVPVTVHEPMIKPVVTEISRALSDMPDEAAEH